MRKSMIFAGAIVLALASHVLGQTAMDSAIVLIPLRSLDAIQADITAAKTRLQVADAQIPVAEGAEKQAQLQIDPWTKQIDLVKAKIDAAKKEKNETAKIALDAEKNALDRQKKLAENNYDLRKAETDLAKAHSDWLSAQIKSWELESELAKKRVEREGLIKNGTTGVGLAAVDQVIRDLEKKTLEAQKDEADKSGNRADKEKNIVNKRLAILDTQNKILTGK